MATKKKKNRRWIAANLCTNRNPDISQLWRIRLRLSTKTYPCGQFAADQQSQLRR